MPKKATPLERPTLLQRLMMTPSLSKRDFWLVFAPFLVWAVLVQARPHILHPRCASEPQSCQPADVLPMDQPGLGIENGPADGYSYLTQNLSGAVAVSSPILYQAAQVALGTAAAGAAASIAVTDLILFLETWGLNGALTEATRLVIQRPRPYVYTHPSQRPDVQNYVSFYSGHTSFAAAACFFFLLMLLRRRAPDWVLLAAGAGAQVLIISTAVYRILAGRHFLTDVLAGAVLGAAAALLIALFHVSLQPRKAPPPSAA